jgi:hypothetical protein
MGKAYLVHRRRHMAGSAERGIEAPGSIEGSRAATYAKPGKYKKALMWTVPLVAAGVVIWYMRR